MDIDSVVVNVLSKTEIDENSVVHVTVDTGNFPVSKANGYLENIRKVFADEFPTSSVIVTGKNVTIDVYQK